MVRVASVTLFLLALTAAPVSAATIEQDKACYVSSGPADAERETVVIKGQDFTPASTVDVLFDGVPMGSALTGSVGEFEIQFPAPYQPTGERDFVITVRDAATAVTQTRRVTNLAMTVKPRRASPSERVRFRGRGFTRLDAPVFAHYLFRGDEQKTVRLGRRPTGPCGTFSAKRRLIPIDGARNGRWLLQVDQRREYAPEPDPVWVRRPIDVEEVGL